MNRGTVNHADANKILWQRGYALVQNGGIRYLNNSEWLNHTDILNPTNAKLNAMLNSTNSMGKAVELYFVDQMDNGNVYGVHWAGKGIAIAREGDGRVVAHEVLHNCGTEDIYLLGDTNEVLPDDVLPGYVVADWGGGYYSSNVSLETLVRRLVMCSGINWREYSERFCIPTGKVYGWKHSVEGDGGSPKVLGQAGVGQSSITIPPGTY